MKQVTIISGKGGTGKTTITAAFATLAKNAVFADCDVDAADLHLILNPEIRHSEKFYGKKIAGIDAALCTQCRICQDICRFDAIHAFRVDPSACEGCRVCTFACPEKAISMQDKLSGHWYISETRCGPMVHARLGIAEDNSGKLVSVVGSRQNISRKVNIGTWSLLTARRVLGARLLPPLPVWILFWSLPNQRCPDSTTWSGCCRQLLTSAFPRWCA